jgi:hypothetical protein
MLPAVIYEMPSHKTYPPKFPAIAEAEKKITECLSDSRGRLTLSYHEAAHALNYRRFGIETKYSGPTVSHDCVTDTFSAYYGAVAVRDADYLRLAAEPEKLARVLVSGEVAERVLMGQVTPGGSDGDFADFLLFAKGRASHLIWIWKKAKETYLQELAADLEQQRAIIHEAAIFENEICGMDRSVREQANVALPAPLQI